MTPRRAVLLGLAATPLAAPGIARAQDALADLRARAEGLAQLRTMLLLRDGEPLVEAAFRGGALDRVANVKSVSKTLLALLTGIGIERGALPGVEARLLPLLGREPAGDARDAITLEHLLTLRAGLGSTSGGNYGEWVSSDDWVGYALRQPLRGEPGGRFIYSTGSTHLLGVALARAAGDDLLALFREWIGAPTGVDFAPWVADPQGYYLGGNDMGIAPRDLARIGRMVLAGGAWEGRQVVPASWIERSWQPRARSPWSGDRYGYGWFLTRLDGAFAAYARGYGGQVLAVLPDRRMVLVMTSDPTQPARSGGYFGDLRDMMELAARAVA